jgi:hypothetical protein
LRGLYSLFWACNHNRFRDCHTLRCRQTLGLIFVKRAEQFAVIRQNQLGSRGNQEVTLGGQRQRCELGHGKQQRAGLVADERSNGLDERLDGFLRRGILEGTATSARPTRFGPRCSFAGKDLVTGARERSHAGHCLILISVQHQDIHGYLAMPGACDRPRGPVPRLTSCNTSLKRRSMLDQSYCAASWAAACSYRRRKAESRSRRVMA